MIKVPNPTVFDLEVINENVKQIRCVAIAFPATCSSNAINIFDWKNEKKMKCVIIKQHFNVKSKSNFVSIAKNNQKQNMTLQNIFQYYELVL